MIPKKAVILISASVLAIGIIGLGGLTLRDIFFPKPAEKDLRQTKSMLHNVFEKNKELSGEVQNLAEKRAEALKEIEEKKKELAAVREKMEKQAAYVKTLTKKGTKLEKELGMKAIQKEYTPVRRADGTAMSYPPKTLNEKLKASTPDAIVDEVLIQKPKEEPKESPVPVESVEEVKVEAKVEAPSPSPSPQVVKRKAKRVKEKPIQIGYEPVRTEGTLSLMNPVKYPALDVKKAEQERKAEEARRAAEAKRAEEAKKAEEAKRAEDAKKAEEAKRAEEIKKAEEAKLAEEAKQAEEAKRAEDAKKAEATKRAEEAKKVEAAKKAEEIKKVEETKKTEEAKVEETKKAAVAKPAEEPKKVEKIKTVEETKKVEVTKKVKVEEAKPVEKAAVVEKVPEVKKVEEVKKVKKEKEVETIKKVSELPVKREVKEEPVKPLPVSKPIVESTGTTHIKKVLRQAVDDIDAAQKKTAAEMEKIKAGSSKEVDLTGLEAQRPLPPSLEKLREEPSPLLKVEKPTEIRKAVEVRAEPEQPGGSLKADYLYNLGVAYTHSGLLPKAAEMFEKALEINPNDAASHYNLGILYDDHLGKQEEALKHYQAYLLLSHDPEKRRKVETWIKISQYDLDKRRVGYVDSAVKAVKQIVFTTPD